MYLLLVSSLYDFATAGAGTFTFEPIANFLVVDAEATKGSFSKVQASTINSVDITVNGAIPARELVALNSRAQDICTTSSKKSFIDAR